MSGTLSQAEDLFIELVGSAIEFWGFKRILGNVWGVLYLSEEGLTAGEVLDLVAEQAPGVVVVGALGPGGLTHVRYLVKRLRGRFPDLRLVVGRWGVAGADTPSGAATVAPGVEAVGLTLVETRDRCLELTRLEPAEPAEERALA